MNEKLDANLRWWLTVTEIVERQPEEHHSILRWRLQGISIEDCRNRLNEQEGKGRKWTYERVRQAEHKIRKTIVESLTPPT